MTSLVLLFLFLSFVTYGRVSLYGRHFILLSPPLDESDINKQVLPLVEDVLGFAALSISLFSAQLFSVVSLCFPFLFQLCQLAVFPSVSSFLL